MNMRWKKFVAGLALSLTAVTGCKQPVFMTEPDYKNTLSAAQLPTDLEEKPEHGSLKPDLTGRLTHKPSDIFDPDRPPRFLTLAEAFAEALDHGTIGSDQSPGVSLDTPTVFGGLGSATYGPFSHDSIRVSMLDPAIVAASVDSALSKFDTHWVSSMNWNTTDRPVGTSLDAFQAAGTTNVIRTQAAELTSSLIKPLPTGGVAAITFDNQYQFTNLPARVNPSYTPSVQFQFEQPLLQGFGVDINQIRTDHPGSILTGTAFNTTPLNAQGEGIVLRRVRFDQLRANLEFNVQTMLLNVEVAYWNLFAAYGQLYAQEIGVRKNLEIWKLTKERVDAGVKNFTPADLYDAQGKYETSRSQWVAALGSVLEAERNLRGLMGLKPDDCTRLVPSDQPTLAPFCPDWEMAEQEALVLAPELVIDREQIKVNQFKLTDLKNRLLPDLRFTSTYNVNGIGTRLDGPDPNQNALRDLASDRFNSWTLGLRADIPIGYRDANAGLRAGRLQLAQAYWALRTDEDKRLRYLAQQFRHLKEFQQQIQINLSAAEAYNNELNVRIQRVRGGTDTPDVTLLAVQFGTQALVQYYQFVGQYNGALANFEFAKGTLMHRDNVMIAEGPLPQCTQVRATEHEEERAKGLILRERADPTHCAAPGAEAEATPPLKPDPLSLTDWVKTRPAMPPAMPPEFNDPLPPVTAPRTFDPTGSGMGGPSPSPTSGVLAPVPTSSVPAPMPTSTSSFGVIRPLNFPEDRKVPGAPPSLGNGTP